MWKAVLVGAILAVSVVAVAHAMDVDDVIGMLRAGIGEDVILKALDASGSTLALTSDDLVDLKDSGASDSFLEELLNREQQTPSQGTAGYGSSYPSSYSYQFGAVYDPFDYYFACYPYYYAYMAPFSFSMNWWYYGGPYHRSWWQPGHGYRVHYYASHWGTRSIWDRGFANARYHIPAYSPIGKEGARLAFGRPGMGRTGGTVWQRSRPVASGSGERGGRGTHRYEQVPTRGADRSPIWGRTGSSYSAPAPPPRNTESRHDAPARSNAAPPSSPPRRVWSR